MLHVTNKTHKVPNIIWVLSYDNWGRYLSPRYPSRLFVAGLVLHVVHPLPSGSNDPCRLRACLHKATTRIQHCALYRTDTWRTINSGESSGNPRRIPVTTRDTTWCKFGRETWHKITGTMILGPFMAQSMVVVASWSAGSRLIHIWTEAGKLLPDGSLFIVRKIVGICRKVSRMLVWMQKINEM